MTKSLSVVLCILLVLAAAYFANRWLSDSRTPSPADLLQTAFHDADQVARQRATLELIQFGPAGRPYLRRILAESDSYDVQAAAIDGIATLKDWQGMPHLLDAIEQSDSRLVQGRAAVAVSRLLGAYYPYSVNTSSQQQSAVLKSMRAEYARMQESRPPETER